MLSTPPRCNSTSRRCPCSTGSRSKWSRSRTIPSKTASKKLPLQFGLDIPNVHHGLGLEAYGGGEPFNATLAVNPDTFRRLSARAEEVGFHTIWIADHLVFPPVSVAEHPLNYQPNTGQGDEQPTDAHTDGTAVRADDPIYEALSTMAFLGALTTRCRIGVGVLVIPYRNPVIAA